MSERDVACGFPDTSGESCPWQGQVIPLPREPALRQGRARASLLPDVIRVAEHRLGAGESGPAMLQACLQAAEWSWRQGDLQATAHWAESGLTLVPQGRVKARLLHLHGLSALRTGAVTTGVQDLRAAVAISEHSDDGTAHARIALDLLKARSLARVFDPDTAPLVKRALRRCPVTQATLRARLVSHLAEAASWQDPAQHPPLARAAVELARVCGDPEAAAFASLVARLAPVPGHRAGPTDDVTGLATGSVTGLATASTAVQLTRAHTALVSGDRSAIDELSRPTPATRPDPYTSCHDGWAAASSAQLAFAAALLDGDAPQLSLAARRLATVAPQWADIGMLTTAVMWPDLHGRADTWERRPFGAQQAPTWLATLRQAVDGVHRATHPVVQRDDLALAAARLPRPAELVPDVAWSTWLALLARVGVLLDDLDLCAEAAKALRPHRSSFVVLGIGIPVGPAGWFLADALQAMGQPEDALAANQEATSLSERLRSQPWLQRCRSQRLRLLRLHERGPAPLGVDDLRVLEWAGVGLTNRAIARRLSVSVPTVERRLSAIYRTLGVSNRAQAVCMLAAGTGRRSVP